MTVARAQRIAVNALGANLGAAPPLDRLTVRGPTARIAPVNST
jgi:hypothetical protein